MKPAAQRRVERALRDIMRQGRDDCSICHAPFASNVRTFGGTTKAGTVVLVGACCATRVTDGVLSSIFVHPGHREVAEWSAQGATERVSPSPTQDRRTSNRALQGVEKKQAQDKGISRGLGPVRSSSQTSSDVEPWRVDDARWFAVRPARSHRLRPVIGNEAEETAFFTADVAVPSGHELQVLVRQLEPGNRLRVAFGRNLEMPIPDDEAVLHALFDLVAGGGAIGAAIRPADVFAVIGRNASPGSKR